MVEEVRIVLVGAGRVPRFRLETASAVVPEVATFAIVDPTSRLPLWSIVPTSFEVLLEPKEFTPEELERIVEAESLDPIEDLAPSHPRRQLAEADPLEDLPPSDPAHQQALQNLYSEHRLPQLGVVSYGLVPAEFRQSVPRAGSPPDLVRGKHYDAIVHTAEGHAQLAFSVT